MHIPVLTRFQVSFRDRRHIPDLGGVPFTRVFASLEGDLSHPETRDGGCFLQRTPCPCVRDTPGGEPELPAQFTSFTQDWVEGILRSDVPEIETEDSPGLAVKSIHS